LWVRQGARLDARPAATGALESVRLDACFLHQRVCVPLDAAVTPVTQSRLRDYNDTQTHSSVVRGGVGPKVFNSEAVLGVWLPAPLPTPRALPDHGALPLAVGVEKDLGGIDV